MKKPKVDPEIRRQQKAARNERINTLQEEALAETEDLQRLFGQRALTSGTPRGLVRVGRQ